MANLIPNFNPKCSSAMELKTTPISFILLHGQTNQGDQESYTT